jgi:hypothetical protein
MDIMDDLPLAIDSARAAKFRNVMPRCSRGARRDRSTAAARRGAAGNNQPVRQRAPTVTRAKMIMSSLSKMLPQVDLYTGLWVPRPSYTREHVVQKSVLKKALGRTGPAIMDVENLYCCHSLVNSARADYKFVDGPSVDYMLIDAAARQFAPPLFARGAVARTVYRMMEKYPDLYDFRGLIIEDDAMRRWIDLPTCLAEIKHDEFIRSLLST